MIRVALTALLLASSTLSAASAPLVGDFECLSELDGPDTYHGTMRVEEPARFGFLSEAATIEHWYSLDLSDPAAVIFDNAFAEQISEGATMVSAKMLEDEFAYAILVRTKKGQDVPVYCLYVY